MDIFPDAFPLLHLPLLAQEIVIGRMQLDQMIRLASCSQRSKKLVTDARIKLDVLTVSNYPGTLTIDMRRGNQTGTIRLVKNSLVMLQLDCFEHQYIGIDGLSWFDSDVRDRVTRVAYPDFVDFDAVCELFFTGLLELFRPTRVGIAMTPRKFLEYLPLQRHFPRIHKFMVWPDYVRLSKADLDFLMQNDKKDLLINERVERGLRYSEPLKVDTINIANGDWLDFEAVLNSESKEIQLHEYPLPPAATLKKFIEKWMTRQGLERMEQLLIRSRINFPKDLSDNVLKDLERAPIVNDARNSFSDDWLKNGRKIRRCDGKVAYVVVGEHDFEFNTRHMGRRY